MTVKGWNGPTRDIARVTAKLRWRAGKLEQKWGIDTETNGNGSEGLIISTRYEWREVPTLDDLGSEQAKVEKA